jgi:hypothetical protein
MKCIDNHIPFIVVLIALLGTALFNAEVGSIAAAISVAIYMIIKET